MSLFLAIHPDDDAVDHLDDALERVRRDPAAQPLRWQPPERWHVTLAFVGDADASVAPALADELDIVGRARGPVGPLALVGAGTFGRQVLWIGVAGADGTPSTALSDLASSVQSAMRRLRIPLERRPWRPHLTIARVRNGGTERVLALMDGYAGPVWTAGHITLVESTGGPNPVHRVLHSVPLNGPQG